MEQTDDCEKSAVWMKTKLKPPIGSIPVGGFFYAE
jgi:hypothetical protein